MAQNKRKVKKEKKYGFWLWFFIIIFISFYSLAIIYLGRDSTPQSEQNQTGEIRKDNWGSDRLYCNDIVTGWVYTFTFEVPQEELNVICRSVLK